MTMDLMAHTNALACLLLLSSGGGGGGGGSSLLGYPPWDLGGYISSHFLSLEQPEDGRRG